MTAIAICNDFQIRSDQSLSRVRLFVTPWITARQAVILEPPKIKSATVSTIAPSICHKVMGPDATILALISYTSKVMLKIFQARLQQYVNCELPDVQAEFRKGRGTRDQIANICWFIEKQEYTRKTSISVLLTMPKPLTVWITINWKILKEMGIPDHLTCLLKNL